MIESARDLLERAVASGHPPAAHACVIHRGAIVHESVHGTTPDALFDLASVTKAIATTCALAVLEVDLDSTIARHFKKLLHRDLTVRELLGHRSGLPAWAPLFTHVMRDQVAGRVYPPTRDYSHFDATQAIMMHELMRAPLIDRGRRVYSDLGFMLLGDLVHELSGEPLDDFCAKSVFAPFGLSREELRFFRLQEHARVEQPVMPTGRTRPREPAPGQENDYDVPSQLECEDPREVDDDNAWALDGVAGHAGLFGNARAVARFGWLLYEEIEGAKRWGNAQSILREMIQLDPAREGSPRALGFDVPAKIGSAAGTKLGQRGPRGAIGHLGFTGCSWWLDLDREISVALLTNRTLPGRSYVDRFRPLRPAFHDLVIDALD